MCEHEFILSSILMIIESCLSSTKFRYLLMIQLLCVDLFILRLFWNVFGEFLLTKYLILKKFFFIDFFLLNAKEPTIGNDLYDAVINYSIFHLIYTFHFITALWIFIRVIWCQSTSISIDSNTAWVVRTWKISIAIYFFTLIRL